MIPNKMDRRLKGAERVLGGEDVLDAISGTVDGKSVGSKDKKLSGVLILTPTRLIFYQHGLMFGHVTEDYLLSRISTINLDSGLMGGTIKVVASGNDLIMKCGLTDQNPAEFVKNVKMQMAGGGQKPEPKNNGDQVVDVADQIQKLAALKEQGILTEEEFDAKKKQLLGV